MTSPTVQTTEELIRAELRKAGLDPEGEPRDPVGGWPVAAELAHRIAVAVSPKVVTTIAELDALPVGAVIHDGEGSYEHGEIHEDDRSFWHIPGTDQSTYSELVRLPATDERPNP